MFRKVVGCRPTFLLKINSYHHIKNTISSCCFLGNYTKSYSLLIGAGAITHKVFMNTANFGKTSLFVESDYKQQISNRLWIVRVNKRFKKYFCGTHPF